MEKIKFGGFSYNNTHKAINCCLAGRLGEFYIQKLLKDNDIKFIDVASSSNYDISIFPKIIRLEVKFSKKHDGKRWQFMLTQARKKSDIIAFVCGGSSVKIENGIPSIEVEKVFFARTSNIENNNNWSFSIGGKISEKKRNILSDNIMEVMKGFRTKAKTVRNTKIFKLKDSGITFIEISKLFGISEKRVKDIYYKELRKRGLKPREYQRKSKDLTIVKKRSNIVVTKPE